MKNILNKHKSIIKYILFGILTTIINIVIYNVLYYKIKVINIMSTTISWVIAVLFAFITNKLFVFDSKSLNFKTLKKEIISFFSCRIITGILDIIIMYISVDIFLKDGNICKILSNIIVIILNYVLSRMIVFNKH